MTDRRLSLFTPRLAAGFSVAGFAALALAGCAAIGDSVVSQAFVDPATYELYDCKQLAPERTNLANRLTKLEGLMRKADSGVAGPVVSEIAYRNEYIAVKARSRLADDTWRNLHCVDQPPAPSTPATPPRPPGR